MAMRHETPRVLAATTGVLMTLVLLASQAAAATNDSFTAYTTNNCGAVDFVDYGEGKPGRGMNDDYLVIHDYCADGHGSVWMPTSTGPWSVRSTTATASQAHR